MTRSPTPRAVDLLGPDGPLSARMTSYESRAGQLAMAEAVEDALRQEKILFCEAGTGTGKTLAYLVPAILSGRKVVVSTATRALQEQIFTKDLPLIASTLGLHPRAALMKGLSNYLCLRRYHAFRTSAEALRPSVAHGLGVVERWASETETGDLGELAGLSEDDPVLLSIASSSDTRIGPSCSYHGECFVTRMKRDAEEARLLIVNHHLFFADLALRGPHPGRVLPDYEAVIFDEAHQLEDTATLFFSTRVSSSRIELMLRDLERTVLHSGPLFAKGGADNLVNATRAASAEFWQSVLGAARSVPDGRTRIESDFWLGPREGVYHRLDSVLEGLASFGDVERDKVLDAPSSKRAAVALAEGFEIASRRATALRNDLAAIVEGAPGRITWAEASDRRASLSSSPIDVSDVFRHRVFESIGSVVLTSATLSSGSSREGSQPFRFVRSRLGVPDAELPVSELVVPSPFDYEENTLLYLPDDLPDPSSPSFAEAAVERAAELISASGGGAFVLTTSVRAMRALHQGLKRKGSVHTVLVQGEAPKSALVSAFKARGDAVLVATMSFWQGVDVPGQSLRLVIIDKIPFPVPTDPVMLARGEALQARGENPFKDLHVPVAKITLKQGFGRLIRTRSDFGVVALLDGRVHRRGYGSLVLSGLPPARRTTNLGDVREFFENKRGIRDPLR